MRNRFAKAAPAGCALSLLPLILFAYSGGPPPARTGAPGERTCIDANCHAGTRVEDSDALVLVTGTALTYTPGGEPQRWTVHLSNSEARAYGFQLSVRAAATGMQAGRLRNLEASTQVVCEDSRLAASAGCAPAHLLQFLQHIEPRLRGEFEFEWTPPAAASGDIHVHLAVNASISGQRNARIHTRRFVLRPVPGRAPALHAVSAASFLPAISPSSWIAIVGSGMEAAQVWIDGRQSVVSFASATQINVLVPEQTSVGNVPIELRAATGATATLYAQVQPVAPAFFTQGRDVAHTRHGDILALYGTGFSHTEPAVDHVWIGEAEASVLFAGTVAPGLFQLNVRIPDLAPGSYRLRAETTGRLTQDGVWVEVGPGGDQSPAAAASSRSSLAVK